MKYVEFLSQGLTWCLYDVIAINLAPHQVKYFSEFCEPL